MSGWPPPPRRSSWTASPTRTRTSPASTGVVDQIMADPSITRVRGLADRAGIATRRLQRLFATYVGVTPKWVIRRSRLHEAVERLDEGHDVDLAFLARDLGYFDQAHFARDFRATVGRPPAAYARTAS
jgi:transcriptional regulator GlxA family with amidase domain